MEDKEAPNSVFTMRIKGMAMLTVLCFLAEKSAEYG